VRRIGCVRPIPTFGARLVPGDGQVDEISQTPSPFRNLMPPAGDSLDQHRDAAKAREHRPLRGLDALGKPNLLLTGERSGVANLTEVTIDQAARAALSLTRVGTEGWSESGGSSAPDCGSGSSSRTGASRVQARDHPGAQGANPRYRRMVGRTGTATSLPA
jgi:hypothetical protein